MNSHNLTDVIGKIENILREKLFHPRLQGEHLNAAITQFADSCKSSGKEDLVACINEALPVLQVLVFCPEIHSWQ
jgi:hypothetical protein